MNGIHLLLTMQESLDALQTDGWSDWQHNVWSMQGQQTSRPTQHRHICTVSPNRFFTSFSLVILRGRISVQTERLCVVLCTDDSRFSAFHPFWLGKWVVIHVITWITGWRQLNSSCMWLFGCRSSGRGLSPRPRLYARSVCDTTAPLQLPLLSLCKYVSGMPLTFAFIKSKS